MKSKSLYMYKKTLDHSHYSRLCPTNPGQTMTGQLGCLNVAITRSKRLNYWGNPVYAIIVQDRQTLREGYAKSTNLEIGLKRAAFQAGRILI